MGGLGGMDLNAMMQQMGQQPPSTGAQPQPSQPVQTDNRPPAEKYAEELKQIKEMGFNDDDAILQILQQTGGNV